MPVERTVIDGQLREIGEGDRWWELREFRDLPYILQPDERIRGLVRGRLLGPRRPRLLPRGRWLLVATDQRLICLRQQHFGRRQVDVRLDEVTGVRHGARILTYRITLETRQRRYRIRIAKADAFRFLGALEPLLSRPRVEPAHAALAAFAWLPGLHGLASAASRLPEPDYATRSELARVEATVERLEVEVDRLQQQVDFLEKLLQKNATGWGEGDRGSPSEPARIAANVTPAERSER